MAAKEKLQVRKREVKSCPSNNKFKKIFWSWLWTLALSLIIVLIIVIVSRISEDSLIVNMIGTFNKEWYLDTFFSVNNASDIDDKIDDVDDVVIVDLVDSFSSRKDIANVIKTVSLYKPKVICVDFTFAKSESYDKGQTEMLWKTISAIKDTIAIVFVDYKGISKSFRKNYMIDSLDLEYGLCDFDFNDFYMYRKLIYDSIPNISALVAQKAGVNLNFLPEPMVINFRNKEIVQNAVEDSAHMLSVITPEYVKNKIVFIGQCSNPNDIYKTPFTINGKKQISGIEEIAFEVTSLISILDDRNNKHRHPYIYMSITCNIFLFVGLFTIYFLFLEGIYWLLKTMAVIRRPKLLNKKMYDVGSFLINKVVVFIIKSFLLLLVEWILFKICFFITASIFYIPNVAFLATSFLFADNAFQLSLNKTNSYYEKY